jgi:hypothetical protein
VAINKRVADQRGTVLEVMQCTHDLFVEHGVTYFLDYGSLLGAIRHKVRTHHPTRLSSSEARVHPPDVTEPRHRGAYLPAGVGAGVGGCGLQGFIPWDDTNDIDIGVLASETGAPHPAPLTKCQLG